MAERFKSVDEVVERLRGADYLADTGIAGVVYLADRLEKPVLVEGPAGVGKTELAKAIAAATGSRLIRLQCYEGLDEAKALYEWNYKKQLLRIQADREHESDWATVETDIFSEEFGFGAEIGISTQKLHARGPMGLPELTTYKYVIWGDGQIRG